MAEHPAFAQSSGPDGPGAPGTKTLSVQCCIVGGGPAGMMLGYLLGRAGLATVVLEKHADFLRDFRGDTVHPSTLLVMEELGLIDGFLQRPHQKLRQLSGQFGDTTVRIGDFSQLPMPYPFIALMPQWDFLNFLSERAKRYPNLSILMSTEARDLKWAGDKVTGVIAQGRDGRLDISANLTVACDGRHSTLRERAGLEVEEVGVPIDVLWFRMTKSGDDLEPVLARIRAGKMMVTLDRGDYWQCAYVIPKGGFERVKAQRLPAFWAAIASMNPLFANVRDDVKDWDDVKLLTVKIDRLKHWSRPGLLCIGDAAHAMSPIGGVGVNLAVQDAVATANLLADTLTKGPPTEAELNAVQRRRMLPTRLTQAIQVQMQNRLIKPALEGTGDEISPPWPIRLISAFPILQGLAARLVGGGVRPEHVHSRDAHATAG